MSHESSASYINSGRLERAIAGIHPAFFAGLFVVFVALVTWSRFYYINPDGLCYIGIARLVARGDFFDAFDAFRGPFISWLAAPLSLFLPELLAIRLPVVLGSLLTAFVTWFVVKMLIQDAYLRNVAFITILFMPAIMNGTALITPDTLLSAAVLLGFYLMLRLISRPRFSTAVLLGLTWAIAYYIKSFAFTFAICFFLLSWLLSALTDRSKSLLAFSKVLALTIAVFILASLPWLLVIHHKYGRWMAGSAGRYNIFYMGAQPQVDDVPIRQDAPWLTHSEFPQDGGMVGYGDPCPPGDVIYTYSILDVDPAKQFRTFLANLAYLVRSLWDIFGLAAIPVLVGLVFAASFCIRDRRFALVLLGCVLWILLYCIVLLRHRYLLPIAPLLVVAACGGYEAIWHRLRLGSQTASFKYAGIVSLLLLLQLVGSCAWGVNRVAYHVRRYFNETSKYLAIARDLAQLPDLHRIAQSSSSQHTVPYLAYLADIPYAGPIVLERHKDDWLDILKKGHISYFFVPSGELELVETKGLEPVYQFRARGMDFQVFKVLYDN